ncbi:MAG TPA: hypothetical protein VKG92_09205 [Flavobacteriales bacterium]|nr:hypothetical protein [Flavobacteriales bacterium]
MKTNTMCGYPFPLFFGDGSKATEDKVASRRLLEGIRKTSSGKHIRASRPGPMRIGAIIGRMMGVEPGRD